MAQETALSAEDSRLIWIDCEMTGLDINNDELCEVSVVPTDFNMRVLDEGIDLIIKPSKAAIDHMNDFVRSMHTRSGLIDEWDTGLTLEEAEQQIIAYVQRFLPAEGHGKAHLAGNSIHSDKKFLDKYMPNLMSNLHYRIIDVSTLKELSRRWYPAVYDNKPAKHGGHRALADIIESIDELRYYREMMFVADQPSSEDARDGAARVEQTSLLRTYEMNGNALTSEDTPEKADY
ncbi:oligoribonuclease [Alloscardovia omnicolens]|uniref:oligoribonuclease n=1 Tax=Alloscardovia omnicolens TaxID=419015 RepID=UPI003A7507BA